MIGDAKMYPWFAYNDYLCFRVDLQGSGDSEGVLTDEYSEEELLACVQVINQVAAHPACDGNVGMMGKSWSAINSLMVAARKDRPPALKAVIVCDGSDDRYNDDVHYMGGAMMFDNISWPSSMWGWIAQPPDPAVVGDAWKEMWKARIDNADFWFKQWAGASGARRLLERDRGARPLRRCRRAGVHHVGLAGRLQEPGRACGHRAYRARQAGRRADRRLGPQISVQRLSGPARRLAELHPRLLVGPLAQGKDAAARGRMAAAPGVARRLEGAEQVDLRRRSRQMGGRGRLLAAAGQGDGPLSPAEQAARQEALIPRDASELGQAGARHRDARDELVGRMRQ